MKHLFYDDYSEGAHPAILEALSKTNSKQQIGYGEDEYTNNAVANIQKSLNTDAAVHLVSAGTQANFICLASMLKPYEAVIAVDSAHINVHEAGAVEATGHKILTVESKDGKLKPKDIEGVVAAHPDEHMVVPKVVFISQATELGSLYTTAEITQLTETAHKHGLYLYMDGARLGVAVTSKSSDLQLSDIPKLGVDMFYIGGTKNGALCGEAIVIPNSQLQDHFRWYLKQYGALLAKGRLLGVQFEALFDDSQLWIELGKKTNEQAARLTDGLKKLSVQFLQEPVANQLFIVLPDTVIEKLKADYGFHVWSKHNESESVIRLVTSWATETQNVDELLADLANLLKG